MSSVKWRSFCLGLNVLIHPSKSGPWYLYCSLCTFLMVTSWNWTLLKLPSLAPAHYSGIIMGTIASQITSLTIVYSNVYSDADRRSKKTPKIRVTGHMRGIHRGPVNSPHKWPVTRKMFPFDDVIMFRAESGGIPSQRAFNVWVVKWTFIPHFWISVNNFQYREIITNIAKSNYRYR